MRIVQILLLAATTALPLHGAHAAEPPALAPITPWNLDYGVENCALQRGFGTKEDPVVFRLMRYGPSKSFDIMVSGKALKPTHVRTLSYEFEPEGTPFEVDHPLFGTGEDGVTTWQFSARFLSADEELQDEEVPGAEARAEWERRFQMRAAEVRSVKFSRGIARPVNLNLGALAKPMVAIDDCIDDLMKLWGLDPAVQKTLQSGPVPKSNPGRWILPSDYPPSLERKGVSGKIPFRLMIDTSGAVTQCKIQALYSAPEFEAAVCPVLTKRAKFDPAIGADGKPVASVWNTSVIFVS